MTPAQPHAKPTAFTLVEVLVTVGIAAILVALLLPAFAGARAAGRESVSLSNLRQAAVAVDAYTRAYREAYPWAPAGTNFRVSPPDAGPINFVQPGDYWALRWYWTALMHDVAPWEENFRTWIGPGAPPSSADGPWARVPYPGHGVPSYQMSDTFFARPELWAPGTAETPELYRPVFTHDVLAPASKVLLFDWEMAHARSQEPADRDRRPMLFVDAHAQVRRVSEAAQPPVIPFKAPTLPLQDTPDGVRGRDY